MMLRCIVQGATTSIRSLLLDCGRGVCRGHPIWTLCVNDEMKLVLNESIKFTRHAVLMSYILYDIKNCVS